MRHASCIAGRRLRFGMLTDLTNVRVTATLKNFISSVFNSDFDAVIRKVGVLLE